MAFDLKALQAKAAAKKGTPAAPVRPAPKYQTNKTPAKIFGAPYATSGPLGDKTEVISVAKIMAYIAGQLPRDQVKGMVDMSDKLRTTYGPYFPFQDAFKSILIPGSSNYLPTRLDNGTEIPGAAKIKSEIKEKLAKGVEGYDLDEVAWHIKKSGAYESKALNTMVDTAGGYVVPPPVLGDLIDLQRNLEVFSNAGASNVDLPPNGRIQFPKLTGGSTAYWVGETVNATASQETLGVLNLEAKYLAIRVPLTQQLMRFSSPSVEGMVRIDMAKQGALAADSSMLTGTGGTQIKGLLTYPTSPSWSQNTDKLLSYSTNNSIFQPEDVANMDALLPDQVVATGWVMRPEMWAKVWNRRASAINTGDNQGAFVFDRMRSLGDGGPALWYDRKVVKSRQVSNTRGTGAQTYLLTGDFTDWLIGRMGVFEFMVDPYTAMQSLITYIQAVQYIDAGPRHAASFVLCDNVNIA